MAFADLCSKERNAIEGLIAIILKDGYLVAIGDGSGDGFTVEPTSDRESLLAAIAAGPESHLIVVAPDRCAGCADWSMLYAAVFRHGRPGLAPVVRVYGLDDPDWPVRAAASSGTVH